MKLQIATPFPGLIQKHPDTAKKLKDTLSTAAMAGALLVISDGIASRTNGSRAQIVNYDSDSGAVQVERNAWNIRTGDMENASNIPLPAALIQDVRENMSQVVRRDRLAPNSVIITPDVPHIFKDVNAYLSNLEPAAEFTFHEDSLSLTTQFNLQQWGQSHAYGEGVELRVIDGDGTELSRNSAFVRGYEVEVGTEGEALAETNQISATYGADSTVEMRVLNIRKDGGEVQESGIYFEEDGDFVVEDLRDGGDRDFNDGKYLEFSDSTGEADAVREETTITSDTEVTETELEPETRVEEIIESDVVENGNLNAEKVSKEVTEWGQVVTPVTASPRLAHAGGAVTEDDELLVYDRYSSEEHVRVGSDGLRIAGQFAPLSHNPKLPPTLVSGSVTFNPFVADNEAGLTGTIGLTQFLNRTHRQATDIFGNEIITPDDEDTRLLEPTGLLNNRRWVGYVPAESTEVDSEASAENLSALLEGPSDKLSTNLPAALSAEQWGYNQTTLASGFYVGGSLTGGLGNQKNTLTRIDSMLEIATDEISTRRTLNTYLTPLRQIETVVTETISMTREAGKVLFDLNSLGELDNARFFWNGDVTTEVSSQEVGRSSVVQAGEEQLIDSVTQEEIIALDASATIEDQSLTTFEDSNANFSPLMGVVA